MTFQEAYKTGRKIRPNDSFNFHPPSDYMKPAWVQLVALHDKWEVEPYPRHPAIYWLVKDYADDDFTVYDDEPAQKHYEVIKVQEIK